MTISMCQASVPMLIRMLTNLKGILEKGAAYAQAKKIEEAALQVQNGTLSSTWRSRYSDNPSHAQGTIATDGTVTLALGGYTPKGASLGGKMSGNWADNAISATGAWANGVPVTGNWARAR